jgi:DNA-binding Xre family transcriptional regulator
VALASHLIEMRLRLPELLDEHDPPLTAYAVAKSKAAAGRITLSTIYRLVRQKGQVESFDAELLEALCDVLGVQPGDLLERQRKRK